MTTEKPIEENSRKILYQGNLPHNMQKKQGFKNWILKQIKPR